jgi:hypothetical protein
MRDSLPKELRANTSVLIETYVHCFSKRIYIRIFAVTEMHFYRLKTGKYPLSSVHANALKY